MEMLIISVSAEIEPEVGVAQSEVPTQTVAIHVVIVISHITDSLPNREHSNFKLQESLERLLQLLLRKMGLPEMR